MLSPEVVTHTQDAKHNTLEGTTTCCPPPNQSLAQEPSNKAAEGQLSLVMPPAYLHNQLVPSTLKESDKVENLTRPGTTLTLMQQDFIAEKEKVILALARVEQCEAQVESYMLFVGSNDGVVTALKNTISELAQRSRALHTSIQEKRILEREIQQILATAREAERKSFTSQKGLADRQKKHSEAQEALTTALTSFLGMGIKLLDVKEAGKAAGTVPDSWKDHELIRLTQRIKVLEMLIDKVEAALPS